MSYEGSRIIIGFAYSLSKLEIVLSIHAAEIGNRNIAKGQNFMAFSIIIFDR